MSSDGGWTRSIGIRGSDVLIYGLGFVVILSGLVISLIVSSSKLTEYDSLVEHNESLRNYRTRVRRAVMNAGEFDMLDAEAVQEILLPFSDTGDDAVQLAFRSDRSGGMLFDAYYINFLDNVPTLPPVNGFVTQGLMLREINLQANHAGIDVAAVTGDIVKASASGIVIFAGWTEDLGYMIILDHGDDYVTVYGHNRLNLVTQRERVERGQAIAQVGNTGISQGPHLHFEIWRGGRSIDPRLLMALYRKQDVSIGNDG